MSCLPSCCQFALSVLLVVTLCHADDAEDGASPTGQPPLALRILDEKAMQINGKIIVRSPGSDLNLTCVLNLTGPAQPQRMAPNIVWYIPSPAKHSEDRIVKERRGNRLLLSVRELQSLDSGNFSCEAQVADEPIMHKSFHLHVRSPATPVCSDVHFQCQGKCIAQIYVCDGKPDCPDGRDEILDTCGKHVTCDDKRLGAGELLKCGDRCRPRHYCCFRGNCSTGHYINKDEACCKHFVDFATNSQYRPYEHDKGAYDRTYLETAIYTIIGCAVAFILIVSIMIVAFCRVHLRQSARLSSYSHMRAARAAAAHPPLAEFDHLVLGGGGHFPAYYSAGPGHMMVTYNINNGVQVMPLISPPSYSEAVQGGAAEQRPPPAASPKPEAGPPPPYASRETLSEPGPSYGSENNNGDINGNSVAGAEAAGPAPAAAAAGALSAPAQAGP